MLYLPENDIQNIQQQLNKGSRLVAGLCASWCNSCENWKAILSQLSDRYPDICFVWLDIDQHPDMVAEVDLDTLPVLLVHDDEGAHFLGPIRPDEGVTERLIQSNNAMVDVIESGIWEFLLEN